MTIDIKCRGSLGRIRLCREGQEVAYLTFEMQDKRKLYATHTVVKPEYQGQGLAQRLVVALTAWAKERSLLIEPVCSYVQRLSERGGDLLQCLEHYSEAEAIIDLLQSKASADRATRMQQFFKTGKGEYAEGDTFLGLSNPEVKALLRMPQNPIQYRRRNLSRQTLIDLWQSPYHEARLLAYYALVDWALRCDADSIAEVYDLYMTHRMCCNNWDLVDVTAPYIIPAYWLGRDATQRQQSLLRLADQEHLWTQRIAVVGSIGLIARGIYEDTFMLVRRLRQHPHDLIHKAMGWALREVGRRIDIELLKAFLREEAGGLPRTTLRYAIEHLSPEERQHFLQLPRTLT